MYEQVNPGEADWGLPETVQQYHTLYPLEDIGAARDQPSQAFGIPTIVLKAVSSRDGQPYTLRRLDSRQAWFPRQCLLWHKTFIHWKEKRVSTVAALCMAWTLL